MTHLGHSLLVKLTQSLQKKKVVFWLRFWVKLVVSTTYENEETYKLLTSLEERRGGRGERGEEKEPI